MQDRAWTVNLFFLPCHRSANIATRCSTEIVYRKVCVMRLTLLIRSLDALNFIGRAT
jgi:hypothetical protein